MKSVYGEDVKMARQHTLKCKPLMSAEKDEMVAKYGCHYTEVGRLLRQRGVGIRE
jgi:hypothetical protein